MNKEKLINFLENLRHEKHNKFMYGTMSQNEYFEISLTLNEIIFFVSNENES